MTTEVIEWVGAVVVVGAVTAGASVINRWVRLIDKTTEESSTLFDRLNVAANALLDDDRTPLSVARLLIVLVDEARKPNLAKWFIARHKQVNAPIGDNALAQDIQALAPELRKRFVETLLTAIAVSAMDHPLFAVKRLNELVACLRGLGAQAKGNVAQPKTADELSTKIDAAVAASAKGVPDPLQRALEEYQHSRVRRHRWYRPEPIAA